MKNRGRKGGGVDPIEGVATAAAGGFAEGAAGGADAGFAVREALDHGEAEAFDE